jgi:uncharacterized membrane protein
MNRFMNGRFLQVVLGVMLVFTGIEHLTVSRSAFRAQVPSIFQKQADLVVVLSGIVEILLGVGLVVVTKYRRKIGWATALFFLAVFWGNFSQYAQHINAFGLNSDRARFTRLLFQPVLIAWALLSTDAWRPGRFLLKRLDR